MTFIKSSASFIVGLIYSILVFGFLIGVSIYSLIVLENQRYEKKDKTKSKSNRNITEKLLTESIAENEKCQ